LFRAEQEVVGIMPMEERRNHSNDSEECNNLLVLEQKQNEETAASKSTKLVSTNFAFRICQILTILVLCFILVPLNESPYGIKKEAEHKEVGWKRIIKTNALPNPEVGKTDVFFGPFSFDTPGLITSFRALANFTRVHHLVIYKSRESGIGEVQQFRARDSVPEDLFSGDSKIILYVFKRKDLDALTCFGNYNSTVLQLEW